MSLNPKIDVLDSCLQMSLNSKVDVLLTGNGSDSPDTRIATATSQRRQRSVHTTWFPWPVQCSGIPFSRWGTIAVQFWSVVALRNRECVLKACISLSHLIWLYFPTDQNFDDVPTKKTKNKKKCWFLPLPSLPFPILLCQFFNCKLGSDYAWSSTTIVILCARHNCDSYCFLMTLPLLGFNKADNWLLHFNNGASRPEWYISPI